MSLPDFSPRAVADLDEILAFVARDKPLAAVKFVGKLKDRCRLLADFPEMGTRRDDLMSGLRASSIGNYVIYYRPIESRVRIERVLHAARDVDALFG
jgi:toxin ParE1/3/4